MRPFQRERSPSSTRRNFAPVGAGEDPMEPSRLPRSMRMQNDTACAKAPP